MTMNSEQSNTEPDVDAAVRLIAGELLSRLDVTDWLSWEDVPLVGEHDFERIEQAAQQILRTYSEPDVHKLAVAHRLLESRAESCS